MAMGVPLVTFGVGGVGEYIVPPASVNIKQESAAGGKQGQAAFTISPNCMLVNVASPQAVADAVEVLVRNKSLRIRLGAAGRMSIERVFAVPRQMKQYEELYSQILHL
ncbi:unnamed protein product [Symbiodinium microadriaticum]|nr:unnamed protein product [Symbiodinium microadriaticum]